MDTLDLLKKLVALPSVNPRCIRHRDDLTGETRVADFLCALAAENGIEARRIETVAGRPTVIWDLPADNGDPGAPLLACFAHIDTVWVPEMPDPFHVRLEDDGFYHGLGVTDDKGSLTAALLAALELKKRGGAPCRFAVACTSDEESGFIGAESILTEHLNPDAAIVMEGTSLDVVTAHKGTVRWRVATRGVSVHSSLVPAGENAIYKAARAVLALEKLSAELIARPQHRILKFPTLSVGTINGGTQANSVPDFCEILIDRRLLPHETPEQAKAEICAALDGVVDYEISERIMYSAPFEIDGNAPFVRRMLGEARKFKPDAAIRGLYCSTEAGNTGGFRIPSVVFGPGDVACAHSVRERIDLAEIDKAVQIIVNTAENFR